MSLAFYGGGFHVENGRYRSAFGCGAHWVARDRMFVALVEYLASVVNVLSWNIGRYGFRRRKRGEDRHRYAGQRRRCVDGNSNA